VARTDAQVIYFLLLATALVAGVGWAVRSANARKSARHAFVGWFVYAGSVIGCLAGGVYERVAINRDVYWGGTAWVGMVVGILTGNIAGGVVWHATRRHRSEPEPQ
jgi:uncharacterized protein YqgC (DUF456 family)